MAAPGQGFAPGRHAIEAIGKGGFLFAGMSHIGAILALPSGIHAWPVAGMADVTWDALAQALSEREGFDFLLIGTGARFEPLSPALARALRDDGIRFEAMSTSSATQTYNILLDEGRKVAAALVAVP
ncbi:MAG: Mth938-like domain-containing protein [Proteobacteria bacterium]|nr:Mth938-like domain-containing protein [Pseudomonadota bacterium]